MIQNPAWPTTEFTSQAFRNHHHHHHRFKLGVLKSSVVAVWGNSSEWNRTESVRGVCECEGSDIIQLAAPQVPRQMKTPTKYYHKEFHVWLGISASTWHRSVFFHVRFVPLALLDLIHIWSKIKASFTLQVLMSVGRPISAFLDHQLTFTLKSLLLFLWFGDDSSCFCVNVFCFVNSILE